MNVKEMIKLTRQNVENRNHEQRLEFLQKSKILDENGYYLEDFFSTETVEASKKKVSMSSGTEKDVYQE